MDCDKCKLMKEMGAKRPTCVECGKTIPLEVVKQIEQLINNYGKYCFKVKDKDFEIDGQFIFKYAEEVGYENPLFFLKLVHKAIDILTKREGKGDKNNG